MSLKVLVVEDNSSLCETLISMLEALGMNGVAAHDADQALRKLDDFHPSVILIDMILPGTMDGLQLIAEIYGRLPAAKIIAMSGDDHSETFFRALRARGVTNSLAKPISLDDLAEAIATATGLEVGDLGEDLIG